MHNVPFCSCLSISENSGFLKLPLVTKHLNMFKTLLLSLTLPLSNAKKILWTGRYHFANTVSCVLAVLLLENLPFPCCKDVFCFGCFGVCFQEAHGYSSFLNFILALRFASLSSADASAELVSGFVEGILPGVQKRWIPEPCFWLCRPWRQICGTWAITVPSLTCGRHL